MNIHVDGDLVLVHSNKDVFVFIAENGALQTSINSPNYITSALIAKKANTLHPFIVYSEKEGSTHSFQNVKRVASTESKTYIAFGKDKNGDLFGLTQEPYSLYKVDPETLTETLVKSNLDIKNVPSGKMRVNINQNGILLSFTDKEKVYLKATIISYSGKVNEISNAVGRKTAELYATSQTFGWKENFAKIQGNEKDILFIKNFLIEKHKIKKDKV